MAATARQSVVQPEARGVLSSSAPESSPPIEALALLTAGGDGRIAVDAGTGLNRYGCGPQPDPARRSTAAKAAVEMVEAVEEPKAAMAGSGCGPQP